MGFLDYDGAEDKGTWKIKHTNQKLVVEVIFEIIHLVAQGNNNFEQSMLTSR